MVPTNLEALRVREGMFASLLAGGIEPLIAAWTLDALSLYVSAYALEQSLVQHRRKHPEQEWVVSRAELVRRFTALPADTFPQTRRYAAAADPHQAPFGRAEPTRDHSVEYLSRQVLHASPAINATTPKTTVLSRSTQSSSPALSSTLTEPAPGQRISGAAQ